jgi:hypothetical protein
VKKKVYVNKIIRPLNGVNRERERERREREGE